MLQGVELAVKAGYTSGNIVDVGLQPESWLILKYLCTGF